MQRLLVLKNVTIIIRMIVINVNAEKVMAKHSADNNSILGMYYGSLEVDFYVNYLYIYIFICFVP